MKMNQVELAINEGISGGKYTGKPFTCAETSEQIVPYLYEGELFVNIYHPESDEKYMNVRFSDHFKPNYRNRTFSVFAGKVGVEPGYFIPEELKEAAGEVDAEKKK